MPEEHVVPVGIVEYLDDLPAEVHSMPVNLYHTARYLIVNAGLPRCLPDRVHVFATPGKIVIRAERHLGELVHEVRTYTLSELPEGAIGRMLTLPEGEWAYAEAEAHFANGLLTVSIPTQDRAEYLRQMQTA
jgi:HSP20 family molecular chaperone IbpA